MSDFFHRDPAKTLDELREALYSQVKHLNDIHQKTEQCANCGNDSDWNDGFAAALYSQINWMIVLIDWIEES
jgi:hypothetical protein